MNDIQQRTLDAAQTVLMSTGQCAVLILTGECARDEVDDLSTIELTVIAEHALAQDLMHARDQWAQQFGAVLSVYAPADSAWENSIDILFDESMDMLHMRLHIFEIDELDACCAHVVSTQHSVLATRTGYTWSCTQEKKSSPEQERSIAEECLRRAWHRVPDVARAYQRAQMPEAYALYMECLEDLALLIRIRCQAFPLDAGIHDLSVDCDDSSARMLQSLTADIRQKNFLHVLSAYADALEECGQTLAHSHEVIPPSKLMIRAIRTHCDL